MRITQDWNEKGLVENCVIDHLKQLGYTYVHGSSLDEERETQGEIVLRKRLADALVRLNPWISENNLNKVLRSLTHMDVTNVMEAN